MRSRGVSSARFGAVFAAFALVFSTVATPAAAGACATGGVTSLGRGWIKISAPAWPTPVLPRDVAFAAAPFAVDPNDADRLLFSNGHALMLSKDGGCTWTQLLTVDPSPTYPRNNGALDRIMTARLHGDHIYLQVMHQYQSASILYSHDLGQTFQVATVGLPPPAGWGSSVESLVVDPSDPLRVYFGIDRNVAPIAVGTVRPGVDLDSVFLSTDGGVTWLERTLPTSRATSALETHSPQLHLDARDPNVLWEFSQVTPTFRSPDGGGTWTEVGPATPEGIDGTSRISTAPNGPFSSVLAVPHGLGVDYILRSDDDGRSFYKLPTPGDPSNALFAGSKDKVIVHTYNGNSFLWRLDSRANRWVDITPPGIDSMWGQRISRLGTKTAVFTYEPNNIYRYVGRL